jgi:phage I-like protein
MTNAGFRPITLSWPTQLSDADGQTPTAWMQVARTGAFVSTRYGKFSITTTDLAQMLQNFREVTPVPPTRLPIDYDHMSLDPKKPGDGIAAGWIVDLELRGNGHELWAKVEWTAEGAKRVKAKEYQFVSPSFVKDYVYKTGQKIGTTLIAAAVTNHPFLEGMASIALSRSNLDLAVADSADTPRRATATSVTTGTDSFLQLVDRIARDQKVDYRRAVRIASHERPDLADAHVRG